MALVRLLNSSFGWDPLPKQREVFNRMSRFILVRPSENLPESLSLVGYTMFRFEREEDEDVVYWCVKLPILYSSYAHCHGEI